MPYFTSTICVVYCSTHLIFLSGQLVLQFKLRCLQLLHPVPQLFSFIPVRHRYRKIGQYGCCIFIVSRVSKIMSLLYLSCGKMTQYVSTYLSLSWLMCSMSRHLRLSLRIFFFFSLSVCLLPLRFSVCGEGEIKHDSTSFTF